jgi:glycosyltransferase involved in cell wall biosynthesis
LIEKAKIPGARLLFEPRKGFAEPLNKGLAESTGEYLLFLDADALPEPAWALAMHKALESSDLVVGATATLAPKAKPSVYGRLAASLFEGHSERTAHARGHALPWGPTCNLGIRRALLEKVGPFSPEATSAFDIDWCWRGMLKGARIAYEKTAKVSHSRRQERGDLLNQFERYGLGEAWLHRTYSFLLDDGDKMPDPLLSAVDAFSRLRHFSTIGKSAVGTAKWKPNSLASALDEVATAFASGVRVGYERPHRECPLERSAPKSAIHWPDGPKSVNLFVPGKGITTLGSKQFQLWQAIANGESDSILVNLTQKLFKSTEKEARHLLQDFRRNLDP